MPFRSLPKGRKKQQRQPQRPDQVKKTNNSQTNIRGAADMGRSTETPGGATGEESEQENPGWNASLFTHGFAVKIVSLSTYIPH